MAQQSPRAAPEGAVEDPGLVPQAPLITPDSPRAVPPAVPSDVWLSGSSFSAVLHKLSSKSEGQCLEPPPDFLHMAWKIPAGRRQYRSSVKVTAFSTAPVPLNTHIF